MKLPKMISAAVAAAALLAPMHASADHGCNGEVRSLVFNTTAALYVDDRGAGAGGIWLYSESNAVPFLQSGGSDLTGLVADPCQHGPSDTLIARLG